MRQTCRQSEIDQKATNLENWEKLASILLRNSIVRVFVHMYGFPVQVSKYDVLGAILAADHSLDCPDYDEDKPNLGDLTISGL